MSKKVTIVVSEEERIRQQKFAEQVKELLAQTFHEKMPMALIRTYGCPC